MKCETLILTLWTLFGVVIGQYQHMMPLQHQAGQRLNPNAAAIMRMRGPLMANRPRWPPAASQPQALAQRPYKPLFMYMKGPPQSYRSQKPFGKVPNPYPIYWKAPLNFRPSGLKDVFRSPPAPLMSTAAHQLAAGPASAQKLLAATSPVQNLIIGPSPVQNLLAVAPKKHKYNTGIVTTTQKYLSGLSHTSQPLNGPVTPTPSVAYPIRVDGEGGPIHTIPAPNLSLADKPIVVPEYNYLDNHNAQSSKIKSGHTYEVTEDSSDKGYHDQYPSQNKYYGFNTNTAASPTKLFPSGNYFSSSAQNQFLPQASALRSQSMAPSLTSQQLFALLKDSTPQQQLSDTYTLPLIQQPQLQQHFLHHTSFDTLKPIQAFSAVYQPQLSGSNPHENVLFKPDPKYIEKIQEQFLRQSTSKPNYQSFNYQEPTEQEALSISDSDTLKTDLQEALHENTDINLVHYNVIRNTKEGTPHVKKSNPNGVGNQSNVIEDSEPSASYNVESNVNFIRYDNSNNEKANDTMDAGMEAVASMFLSEIDNIATSSLPPEYIAKLKNKDVIDNLASYQVAEDLMSVAKNDKKFNPLQQEYFNDFNPSYLRQNNPDDIKPILNQQYNNEFTPNNGLPFMINNEKQGENPIRIFVPDQYDDINTQPMENIKVSASLSTGSEPKNDMTIVFENDDMSDHFNYQQEYDEQDMESENNSTNVEAADSEHTTENAVNNNNPDDVVVVVPQNITNPTLDILTKDWKTSIVIKPKTKISSRTSFNQISEFGSRIKPKRD